MGVWRFQLLLCQSPNDVHAPIQQVIRRNARFVDRRRLHVVDALLYTYELKKVWHYIQRIITLKCYLQ